MGEPVITVVGLLGGVAFGAEAVAALSSAGVVVGSRRQLEDTDPALADEAERLELSGPLDAVLDLVGDRLDGGRRVCVLASGDPGFFGIVRALGHRFGSDRLVVHPAPSSIAMAFARLGLPWDDAAVVSAHGRSLDDAVGAIAAAGSRVAVLTSPDNPPQSIGTALLAAGLRNLDVAVVSNIGTDDESVHRLDLAALAAGGFDAMSVVVLQRGEPVSAARLAWGLDESAFSYRDGMITKAETRAIALGKLALPPTGVLWDVGAGSGSVGVESARLAPGLRVMAIERDAEQCARIEANAARHRVSIEVVHGSAPEALSALPGPDRVFVGGGGLDGLDAALARLRPDGVVVATFAIIERAVAAHRRLGHMVQVNLSRAQPIGELGARLVPENPVFICWGPDGMGTG